SRVDLRSLWELARQAVVRQKGPLVPSENLLENQLFSGLLAGCEPVEGFRLFIGRPSVLNEPLSIAELSLPVPEGAVRSVLEDEPQPAHVRRRAGQYLAKTLDEVTPRSRSWLLSQLAEEDRGIRFPLHRLIFRPRDSALDAALYEVGLKYLSPHQD